MKFFFFLIAPFLVSSSHDTFVKQNRWVFWGGEKGGASGYRSPSGCRTQQSILKNKNKSKSKLLTVLWHVIPEEQNPCPAVCTVGMQNKTFSAVVWHVIPEEPNPCPAVCTSRHANKTFSAKKKGKGMRHVPDDLRLNSSGGPRLHTSLRKTESSVVLPTVLSKRTMITRRNTIRGGGATPLHHLDSDAAKICHHPVFQEQLALASFYVTPMP